MPSALGPSRSAGIGRRDAFLGCLVINQPMISFSGRLAAPCCPFPSRLPFLPPPTSPSHSGVQSTAASGERAKTGRGAVTCGRTCWGARYAARERGRGGGEEVPATGLTRLRAGPRARWARALGWRGEGWRKGGAGCREAWQPSRRWES